MRIVERVLAKTFYWVFSARNFLMASFTFSVSIFSFQRVSCNVSETDSNPDPGFSESGSRSKGWRTKKLNCFWKKMEHCSFLDLHERLSSYRKKPLDPRREHPVHQKSNLPLFFSSFLSPQLWYIIYPTAVAILINVQVILRRFFNVHFPTLVDLQFGFTFVFSFFDVFWFSLVFSWGYFV